VWFAFDVGQSIDLDRCAGLLQGSSRSPGLETAHHAPSWFRFQRSPLLFRQRVGDVAVGRWRVDAEVELTMFEFGAVSIAYEIAVEGELDDWIDLSCTLATSDVLAREAQARAEALLEDLRAIITRPGIAEVTEDYIVFRWGALAPGTDVDAHLARIGADLTRLLRAERGSPSPQEIADALAARLSFLSNDLLVVDWNAAVVFDDEPEDVLRVLEFANVQLLELRFLDAQLDHSLDRAYELIARRDWRKRLAVLGLDRDLQRVSAMQVDGAILFERVGNTLKLIGDQYLARVLRLASQRFRSAEWNSGILRKLETLDQIYEKLHDHASVLRAEFLEWIIIALIGFEIVWAIVRG
jgi:hypothetical protein